MLRITCFAALLMAITGTAQAQSSDAIRAYLARSNPGCDIFRPEETYRGPLPGAAGPVVVMVYTVEGCGGGNNWARLFGVFAMTGGAIFEYTQPTPPPFVVDGACVTNGALVISGLGYGPNDAQCCPSQRRTARYRIDGRTVIAAR